MRYLVTLFLTIFLAGGGVASDTPSDKECARTKEKIRDIRSRMRSGYTRAQGERMEEQLRKLRKQRKAKCR